MSEREQYKQRLRITLAAAKICIFEVDLVNRYTLYR